MSLRALAHCIDAMPSNGQMSVIRDFFGYDSARGPTEAGLTISLRSQISLLRGRHFHINVIRVGHEHFLTPDEEHLDVAIATARSILAQVGLGIGRAQTHFISDLQAAAVGVVGSWIAFDDQAQDLTDMFTVDNDALDAFFVLEWGVFKDQAIGRSAVGGPCDKDDGWEMTGLVVSFSELATTTGLTLAHEIGHYLGLGHIGGLSTEDLDVDGDGTADHDQFPVESTNLMYPANIRTNNQLVPPQGSLMKLHCFVRPGC